jgi:molecular chaperone DnaK (HSP70)
MGNRAPVVGIDLGTTHTVVAREDAGEIHLFPISQLVTPTEIASRPLFPSSLYMPAHGEAPSPDNWGDAPWIAGELARRRGTEVPGRGVTSAKSWLCHAGVDRTAAILPWTARAEERDQEGELLRISPLDASGAPGCASSYARFT